MFHFCDISEADITEANMEMEKEGHIGKAIACKC